MGLFDSTAGQLAIGLGGGLGGGMLVAGYQQQKAIGRQADAAQRIAEAQLQMAHEAALAAEMTPYELQLKNRLFAQSEEMYSKSIQNIDMTMAMANSLDPLRRESANQALALLAGKEASSLGPVRAERQRERDNLVSTLRERLGPGAETSSAGIEALNRFDQQSDLIAAQTQQQALQGALGAVQMSFSQTPDVTRALVGGAQATTAFSGLGAQIEQNARQRLVNAKLGVAGYAGASNIGDLLKAQGQAQLWGQALSFGAGLAGTAVGAMAGMPALGTQTAAATRSPSQTTTPSTGRSYFTKPQEVQYGYGP